MTQNSLPEMMTQTVLSFIMDTPRREKKAYLAEHPELLTDDAFELLSMLIKGQEKQDPIDILTQHRDLLAEARQKGLDAAFAELIPAPSAGTNALIPLLDALMACNSLAAVLLLAAQQPELLCEEMNGILQQSIANARSPGTQEGEEWANHVAARQEMVRQLRQIMDKTGMSPQEVVQAVRRLRERPPQPQSRSYQQAFEAVRSFIHPATWNEKKRIVNQKRKLLLSDAALRVFADLLEQYKEHAEMIRTLTEHRDLLIHCQKKGIEAAFAAVIKLLALLEALIPCDSFAGVLELAAQQPQLLSDEMDAFLQQEIADARSQGTQESHAMANHVAAHHKILRQLRQIMDKTGMSAQEVVQAVHIRGNKATILS